MLLLLLTACLGPTKPAQEDPPSTAWIAPTLIPTSAPTPLPTATPTAAPTLAPTLKPTPVPTAGAQVPAATLAAEQQSAAAIDQYLAGILDQGAFNGSVLVAQNGQVLLEKGYGLADSDRGVPNTGQTKFRIASLTKQFTAMAVLILQAEGRLKVADRVCHYLPDCPPDWGSITIRQLLSQTSGIPDLTGFPDFDETYPTLDTLEKSVGYFKKAPLDFTPGKGWAYSNSGYILLGYLIQQVSGVPYESFLQEKIFAPLGMQSTGFAEDLQDLAVGSAAPGIPLEPMDLTWLSSAGELYSTVADLYRWDQALYGARLAPQALVAEMFKAQASVPQDNPMRRLGSSYGYGWVIGSQLGRRVELHSGAISGYSAFIERFPADKATIILLSNLDGKDYSQTAEKIAGMLFGD
jgi:CubicO group peptidase (beta-lactamase class C family)